MPSPHATHRRHGNHIRTSDAHDWLVDLAIELTQASDAAAPAELVWRARRPHPVRESPPLRRLALPDDDPVAAIVGRTLPAPVDLVGVAATARSRVLCADGRLTRGRLVHLVTVDGISVTVLPGPQRRRIGPTPSRQAGRVPDVCRCLLGLPTTAAPATGIAAITHLWLAKVARLAATTPGLGWGPVLAAHPFVELLEDVVDEGTADTDDDRRAATGGPVDELAAFADLVHDAADAITPSMVAGWTGRCARQWSWRRLRRRVAAGRPDLIGHAFTAAQAAWMDDAMFARWTMGELPAPGSVLEALDATLHPVAVDRLRTTLGLSGLSTTPR